MNWATLSNCEMYHSKISSQSTPSLNSLSSKNYDETNERNIENECIVKFLESAKLEKFIQKFNDEGFIEIGDLIEADENTLLEIGLKTAEIKRLKRHISKIKKC